MWDLPSVRSASPSFRSPLETWNSGAPENEAEQAAGTVVKEPGTAETLAVSSSDARCARGAAPLGPPVASLSDETGGLARRRRLPWRRPAASVGWAQAPRALALAPREVVALKPGRSARRIACYRSTSSFPSMLIAVLGLNIRPLAGRRAAEPLQQARCSRERQPAHGPV
jgi:hypothetical protein